MKSLGPLSGVTSVLLDLCRNKLLRTDPQPADADADVFLPSSCCVLCMYVCYVRLFLPEGAGGGRRAPLRHAHHAHTSGD